MSRAAALAVLAVLIGARPSHAQLPQVRGYYLNVPTWADSTRFAVGGIADLNRLRLMTEPSAGAFTLQIAYEQLLAWTGRAGARPGAIFGGIVPGGGEWLDLGWTIKTTDQIDWRHRFDRLNLRYAPGGPLELVLGRQAVSWATTLLLTPADPFAPFDPSDPFREYRAGVDAIRVQAYPGPLSDLDLVVRPTRTMAAGVEREDLTVVGRARTAWKGWEISAWAGALYDEPALAVGAAGGVGPFALRGEAELREDDDELILRGTIGVDGRIDTFGNDLYIVLEYQHDDFGASSAAELSEVVASDAFARGELQVLGRDETVAQASYQFHPLWRADLLLLWNLNDGSALIAPGASYSLASEVTARGGIFVGAGDETPPARIPSEYGIVPTFLYLSLSVFF